MGDLDRALLRSLADWPTGGAPVSSVYLDVDGRRYLRRADFLPRAQLLCDRLNKTAERLGRDGASSVCRDTERIMEFLEALDRDGTRSVAIFSCSAAELWEDVLLPWPVPDRGTVGPDASVLRLEAMVETYQSFCTVLVDREKGRILLSRSGRILEELEVHEAVPVPNQHRQGGPSQSRYQRHVDDHAVHHLRHVADVLLAFHRRTGFDHLILAGPELAVAEFERGLHDYLRRRVVARIAISMSAPNAEVLARSLGVEEGLEAAREREVLDRLSAGAGTGRGAATGLSSVLHALNEGRVETLVVPFGVEAPGVRCASCGRLATQGRTCITCGGALEAVTDVVESAVGAALRQGARIEPLTFTGGEALDGRQVGALLRY